MNLRGESSGLEGSPCQGGSDGPEADCEEGETGRPPCLRRDQGRLEGLGLLQGRLPGKGPTARSVNLSCPSTSLFPAQGKVGPWEGRESQLVNVKNMNKPPNVMSWALWLGFQGGAGTRIFNKLPR